MQSRMSEMTVYTMQPSPTLVSSGDDNDGVDDVGVEVVAGVVVVVMLVISVLVVLVVLLLLCRRKISLKKNMKLKVAVNGLDLSNPNYDFCKGDLSLNFYRRLSQVIQCSNKWIVVLDEIDVSALAQWQQIWSHCLADMHQRQVESWSSCWQYYCSDI